MQSIWRDVPAQASTAPETHPVRAQRNGGEMAVAALAIVMMVVLVAPLLSLLVRTAGMAGNIAGVQVSTIFSALTISMVTTAASVVFIAVFGTPLAWLLARRHFPMKRFLTVLVELPIVMPPVVAGLALLTALGRRGIIGSWLAIVGITIPFTPIAVILAQVFVAAPFYVRAAQSRFGILPRELEDAAGIDGADGWRIFWHVILPLSWPALASGLVISWARALGEFGATILFAGNLQGRTQTMPLLVYSSLESDLGATFVVATIMLILAALALGLTRAIARLDRADNESLRTR